jgi:hypothetical protein
MTPVRDLIEPGSACGDAVEGDSGEGAEGCGVGSQAEIRAKIDRNAG